MIFFISVGYAHLTDLQLQLRVNTVHEKGTVRYTQQDSLDEAGGEYLRRYYKLGVVSDIPTLNIGGNLNAASRQALMQKLARIDTPPTRPQPM